MLTNTNRSETEIFSALESLCTSPGYAHAIAWLCLRDNTLRYDPDSGLTADDVLQQFSLDRLVRTEISALIGLAIKNDLNLEIPTPDVMQAYLDKTDELLKELHSVLLPKPDFTSGTEAPAEVMQQLIESGAMIREAIFYGGESAFHFQYRDLGFKKYQNDDDFFRRVKGYSLQQAYNVISSIEDVHTRQVNDNMEVMIEKPPEEWTGLPAFIFSYEDVANACGHDIDVVKAVLSSFTAKGANEQYQSIDSFNVTNAYPLIELNDDKFLMFQYYSLLEALYETPFFWFLEDESYKETAFTNRGAFTEEFARERLEIVFGKERVFSNVNVYNSAGDIVGEIDVLVVYANRAIVLQAKSKKLTIAARQGSKDHLEKDFEKAVQKAYGQGLACSEFMLEPEKFTLKTKDGVEIERGKKYKELFILCIVSDHYPALFAQSQQFLKYQETEIIKPPYIADVFFLDTLTEMLDSPLKLLSYISRRTQYAKQINASFELSVLGYHLKRNLWIDDEYSHFHIGDDVSADLDMAMMARRRDLPGARTPEGILTKFSGTPIDRLIKQIETIEQSNVVDLGFLLLSLNEEALSSINLGVQRITKLSLEDGRTHDMSMFFDEPNAGFTIHTNNHPNEMALDSLGRHCERRKYAHHSSSWYGICLSPKNGSIRFALALDFPWKQSERMDELVRDLPKPDKKLNLTTKKRTGKKIGRNDPCPCGSGKKFKKCCL